MDTLGFFQRVLPTEGVYVLTAINSDTDRKQAYFDTVEQLANAATKLDKLGNNTYFAYSAFQQRGNRKQVNVRATKVIAIDVDCGVDKPYADQRAGLAALVKFIKDTGLPKPMIISSGRGLHVYWVLDTELQPVDWKPLADAMKLAAQSKSFEIDMSVTGDSARVLRPIGTHNPKNGAEVKLLMDAPIVSVVTLENILSGYMLHAAMSQSPQSKQSAKGLRILEALSNDTEYPPAVPSMVEQKCKQVEWALAHPDKVTEPLWYTLIGVAAHCLDSEATAVEWSRGHPQFSEAGTVRKLKQWRANTTGPATCKRFETERPKGCDGCKLKGKITTPAQLGIKYDAITEPLEAPDPIANEIKPPFPYKRTAKGMMVTTDDTDVEVCGFEIYPVGYGRDESLGYETVRYKWNRQHMGWQDLSFRQAYLADGSREFPTSLADQGIVLHGRKQTELFQNMLRSYMDELRKSRRMTNLYATMGWKEDDTQFVIGDHLVHRLPNGTVTVDDISLAAVSNRLGSELYQPKGSLQAWTTATKVLVNANMPWHQFALLLGFAAPLMKFTGLHGLVVSLTGDTGRGKSLIQLWQQSIWGAPEKLHYAAKFTANAMYSRLGLYCNLPMTIDEVTMVDPGIMSDFCYMVSQGRDKGRLSRNASEQQARTWATIVTVSTNNSVASMLDVSGSESNAQLARLLELHIPKHVLFSKGSDAGRKIVALLANNHGLAGPVFAKALVEYGPDALAAMVQEAITKFSKKYNAKFAGHERYWEAALALTDLGGNIAYDLGLVTFKPNDAIEWVMTQLNINRKAAVDNKRDWFALLNEYLHEEAENILTVFHTTDGNSIVDRGRMPRGSITARFDFYRRTAMEDCTHGVLYVTRPQFKKWLAARGLDLSNYKAEMRDAGVDATPSIERIFIGRGTELKQQGQPYVLGFNLAHANMAGFLTDADDRLSAEDLTFGQMVLVKT